MLVPAQKTEQNQAEPRAELTPGWAVHARLMLLPQVIYMANRSLLKKMSSKQDITLSLVNDSTYTFPRMLY